MRRPHTERGPLLGLCLSSGHPLSVYRYVGDTLWHWTSLGLLVRDAGIPSVDKSTGISLFHSPAPKAPLGPNSTPPWWWALDTGLARREHFTRPLAAAWLGYGNVIKPRPMSIGPRTCAELSRTLSSPSAGPGRWQCRQVGSCWAPFAPRWDEAAWELGQHRRK